MSERNGKTKGKKPFRDNKVIERVVCEQTWKAKTKVEEGRRAVGHTGLLWGGEVKGERNVW